MSEGNDVGGVLSHAAVESAEEMWTSVVRQGDKLGNRGVRPLGPTAAVENWAGTSNIRGPGESLLSEPERLPVVEA